MHARGIEDYYLMGHHSCIKVVYKLYSIRLFLALQYKAVGYINNCACLIGNKHKGFTFDEVWLITGIVERKD